MQIPDGLVYASIVPMCGGTIWVVKQLIWTTVKGDKGEQGAQGATGGVGPGMTVRDYKEIADLLRKELNGRYMMAPEARQKFDALEKKNDALAEKLDCLAEAIHSRLGIRPPTPHSVDKLEQ